MSKKKVSTMIKWLNDNSGIIGIISPLLLSALILFGSKFFVTQDQYKADKAAQVEYQKKNDDAHQKMADNQVEMTKALTRLADQAETLKDHETRIRNLEAKSRN